MITILHRYRSWPDHRDDIAIKDEHEVVLVDVGIPQQSSDWLFKPGGAEDDCMVVNEGDRMVLVTGWYRTEEVLQELQHYGAAEIASRRATVWAVAALITTMRKWGAITRLSLDAA